MKIAFITDSGCGLSIDEMSKKQIFSLPLQISIEMQNFFDLEQIKMSQLIEYLKQNKTIKTSMPNLGLIDELFKNLKNQAYNHIIAVPISSGLSGTMNALYSKAKEYGIKINCIETYTTSKIQQYIVEYLAKNLKDNIEKIDLFIENANKVVDTANTYILPKDLSQLKKSGRLTKTALMIANFLNIKPILKINKDTVGKIDSIDKVRTFKRAIEKTIDLIKQENINDKFIFYIAHVDNYGDALYVQDLLNKNFPDNKVEIIPLVNPVAAHCGLGAIAIQYFEEI